MDNPEILATQGTQDEEMCQFPKFESFYFSSNIKAIFSSTLKKKSRAIVVTPASASGSVKFFVRFHFSKTIQGIHLKLGILVHYQKRNQLQQGR